MPVISESQVPTSTMRTPGESSSPSFGPYVGTISAAPAGLAKATRGTAAAAVSPSAIADRRFKSSMGHPLFRRCAPRTSLGGVHTSSAQLSKTNVDRIDDLRAKDISLWVRYSAITGAA